MSYQLRAATRADQDALRILIARSARGLGAQDYSPEQIEGALQGAFGVDTQLIDDGTYFVVEFEGRAVGCGGSMRRKYGPSSSIPIMPVAALDAPCSSVARARRARAAFAAWS